MILLIRLCKYVAYDAITVYTILCDSGRAPSQGKVQYIILPKNTITADYHQISCKLNLFLWR